MFVSKIMSRETVVLDMTDNLETAARLMEYHGIASMPVCQDKKVRGIITDRDIALLAARGISPQNIAVKDVMSKRAVTVDASADVSEALELMSEHKLRRLPVTMKGNIVGMVSLGDIARTSSFSMEAARVFLEIAK